MPPPRIGRPEFALIASLAAAAGLLSLRRYPIAVDGFFSLAEGSTFAILAVGALLAGLMIYHQSTRLAARAEARAAAARADHAHARARGLEQLVVLGQALGRALDLEALTDAAARHLPDLVGTREPWVLVRTGEEWRAIIGTATGTTEALADRAFWQETTAQGRQQGWDWGGQVCFPLIVGDAMVGVLGIAAGEQTVDDEQRRVLAAAAALLAIAVKNVQLFQEIREHSLVDGLTGCFNRTYGLGVLDTELRRARRSSSPLALIMFDLDHFKSINDRFGHLCGDTVLAAVGRRMREQLRNSDVKCRYGGEEFLIVLPETPYAGALHVAETLRREIGAIALTWRDKVVNVTASFGMTMALPGELDANALIARADSALYRAKRDGRHCVRVELEAESAASDAGAAARASGPS